jgi:hypothetical protein
MPLGTLFEPKSPILGRDYIPNLTTADGYIPNLTVGMSLGKLFEPKSSILDRDYIHNLTTSDELYTKSDGGNVLGSPVQLQVFDFQPRLYTQFDDDGTGIYQIRRWDD